MNLTLTEIPFDRLWRESHSACQMIHRLHEEIWLPSSMRSITVTRLLHDRSEQLASGLGKFWRWYFENFAEDKLDQFKSDCEIRIAYNERQVQRDQLTTTQANRETVQALTWLAFDESEYGELDNIAGKKLREFVRLRRILRDELWQTAQGKPHGEAGSPPD